MPIIIMILGVLVVRYITPQFGDDSVVEEVLEYIIHQETGVDVDFTPNSDEFELGISF